MAGEMGPSRQSECCSGLTWAGPGVGPSEGKGGENRQFKEFQVSQLLVYSVKKPSLSPVLPGLEDNDVEGACVLNIQFD